MPNKNEQDHLLEHNYDGIQEFDNPMPRWWVYIFWATIVFSVLYWLNVPGIGTGEGRIANYESEMAAAAAAEARLKAAQPPAGASGEQLTALTRDASVVALGKDVFAKNCAACHRADGGGQIGPNLTDDAWLHGGTIDDIQKVVRDGVLEKGMPPWGKVLKPDQLDAVTAYVFTLRGTNPPDPKAPQGEIVAQ
ncbi:MAG TPA: cbb3-type cytochrome c oxidase N-terminal domain-containing protein [Gemmatimonadaceae bacterium]|jgi:cytochrome c oxidase cbb3-type subunit 3|nr:cbb3-type cytochrome c oxidase N-terminal domain-containing protein [Gemmatimonadaceae bacterium]